MNVLNLPRPAWMSEDHVLLEEQARRFFAAEFVPHIEQWNEDGIMDRAMGAKAGGAGFLCASIPEAYGGAGGTFAHDAVINREIALAGLETFGAPLHSGIVAPYILHYGTEEQKQRWLPGLAQRRTRRRHRHDASPAPAPTCRACARRRKIRQRVRDQRVEDVHHQRPARQPDHRGRQDRSGTGRQGRLADGGRDRRGGGLPPRAQAQEARVGLRPTPPSCSSKTCGCPPRACSAPRKARASSS